MSSCWWRSWRAVPRSWRCGSSVLRRLPRARRCDTVASNYSRKPGTLRIVRTMLAVDLTEF